MLIYTKMNGEGKTIVGPSKLKLSTLVKVNDL